MKKSELLDALAGTPLKITEIFVRCHDEDLRKKPSPQFSLLENIAHLRDLELEAVTARIRRILSEDHPTLENFDGTAVAAASRYNDETSYNVLQAFCLGRRRNVETLSGLEAAAFSRTAAFGDSTVTLAELLENLAAHDAEHLAAIRNLAAAFEIHQH